MTFSKLVEKKLVHSNTTTSSAMAPLEHYQSILWHAIFQQQDSSIPLTKCRECVGVSNINRLRTTTTAAADTTSTCTPPSPSPIFSPSTSSRTVTICTSPANPSVTTFPTFRTITTIACPTESTATASFTTPSRPYRRESLFDFQHDFLWRGFLGG